MEDTFLKFPHLGQQILNQLDNKSLVNCRLSSRSWLTLIDYEKIAPFRAFKLYTNNSDKNLQKILCQLDPKNCIELTIEVRQMIKEWEARNIEDTGPELETSIMKCQNNILAIENLTKTYPKHSFGRTLYHDVAIKGSLEIFKSAIKNTKDIDIFDYFTLTPLQYAACYKNFSICEFIIDNVEDEDKNPIIPNGLAANKLFCFNR